MVKLIRSGINKSVPLHKKIPLKLLIKNSTVIDPFSGTEIEKDILIIGGVIAEIGKNITVEPDHKVIDASGKYVSPGFFDMHVHLREPGYTEAENFSSGTNAAMAGGVTGLAAMANTEPCVDKVELLNDAVLKTKDLLVKVYQIPAVTKGRKGNELVDMKALADCGAAAFSDDGSGIGSSEIMRAALTLSKSLNKPVLVHPEDHTFTQGAMNESAVSKKLKMSFQPNISESINIARDIEIAGYVNAGVHFQHVSASESVDLIRKAKKDKLKITCEVTPHHFSLSDKEVESLSTDFKMNPPLRKKKDVSAICKALKDGTIDVIASDHAPHTAQNKSRGFESAPFGVLGLETLFSAGITYLVRSKKLSLMEFIKKITVNPRKILNIGSDLLKEGVPAELTIFDIERKWKVDRKKLRSLSENTCYHNDIHYGKVLCTINNSRIYQL